jgi:hypothetical protein
MDNIDKNTRWGNNDMTFNGKKPPEPEPAIQAVEDPTAIKYSPHIVNEHELVFDNPWLKVKKAGGYFYSERKGVDSIAFILVAVNASDERRIGLIHEWKDPIGNFLTTAFGGSIDDEKYHNDLRLLVKDEVMEEAGFDVQFSAIKHHGSVMVSTQSNQFCHLFSVEVDKMQQGERTTTNPTELRSAVSWLTMMDIAKLEDWKAQAIILRRMLANNGLVFVKTAK